MATNLPTLPVKEVPSFTIKSTSGWLRLDLKELWRYRELIYFFVYRDIKVRYKQTVVGGAWAIAQPFFQMVIFSVVFGALAKLDSHGIPYPIFTYTALLPWMYFANSLTNTTNVVVEQARVITKVYFPRVLLPLSAVVGGLVDFAVAFTILIGLMFYFHTGIRWELVFLPLFLLLALLTALAVGLWLSALNAIYRDVRYVLPFMIQLWLFASPVAYSTSYVPERYRFLFGLNPMAGVVQGFRWAVLGDGEPPGQMLLLSTAVVLVILVGGLFYFRRMERRFADVV